MEDDLTLVVWIHCSHESETECFPSEVKYFSPLKKLKHMLTILAKMTLILSHITKIEKHSTTSIQSPPKTGRLRAHFK
jgi:hypothetical protein